MTAAIFIPSTFPALDSNGNPYNAAKWYFSQPDATTPVTVYLDLALTVPAPNGVACNAAGKFPVLFLDTAVPVRARMFAPGANISTAKPKLDVNPYPFASGSAATYLSSFNILTYVTSPLQFGAVADPTVDNLAAFTAMFLSSAVVFDLGGQSFGVYGKIDQPHINNKTIRNGTIYQLNPHVDEMRTLLIDNMSGFQIENIRVYRGASANEVDPIDPTASGQMGSRAGLYISNSHDFIVTGYKCYNGGVGSGSIITNSYDFEYTNNLAADCNPVLTADPTDDRVQGHVFELCYKYKTSGNHTRNLSVSWTGKGDALRYWSRGFVQTGCYRYSNMGDTVDLVDESFDTTGSNACYDASMIGCHASNCRTWGFKHANLHYQISVQACTATLCGKGGFVASGAGLGNLPTHDITYTACRAYNCGDGTGSSAGFLVINSDNAGLDLAQLPKRIKWVDCEAIDDRGGGALMLYGFYCDGPAITILSNAASLIDKPLADNCRVSGAVTQDALRVRFRPGLKTLVDTRRSVDQVIPTGAETTIVFDSELVDTLGEYNPANGRWTCKYDGVYRFSVSARVAANPANTEITLFFKKNQGTAPVTVGEIQRAYAATTDLIYPLTKEIPVVKGDTIECRILQPTGVNMNLNSDSPMTNFTVSMVEAL